MSTRRRKPHGVSFASLNLEDHLATTKTFIESQQRSFEQQREITHTPDQMCEIFRRISKDIDEAFGIILQIKATR